MSRLHRAEGKSELVRLHLLGTGSGLTNPDRGASAYLLESASGDLLLDAGEPVASTLARRRYDWSRLLGIVLSHTHADHLGGLPMLLQQIHLSGREGSLALHAPLEFAQVAREHLGLFYLFPEAFRFELRVEPIRPGTDFQVGGFAIRPTATRHLSPAADRTREHGYPNLGEAFAFAISAGPSRLFYSGDVGSFQDIEEAIGDARYAVLDSTHVEWADIMSWSSGHPGTTVILSHVVPGFDTAAWAALQQRFGGARVRLATEGETLEL